MSHPLPTRVRTTVAIGILLSAAASWGQENPAAVTSVEPQPLLGSIERLIEAMDYVGTPLPKSVTTQLKGLSPAGESTHVTKQVQQLLDPFCLAAVSLKAQGPPLVQPGTVKRELLEHWDFR